MTEKLKQVIGFVIWNTIFVGGILAALILWLVQYGNPDRNQIVLLFADPVVGRCASVIWIVIAGISLMLGAQVTQTIGGALFGSMATALVLHDSFSSGMLGTGLAIVGYAGYRLVRHRRRQQMQLEIQ